MNVAPPFPSSTLSNKGLVMTIQFHTRWLLRKRSWLFLLTLAVLVAAFATASLWVPEIRQLAASTIDKWTGASSLRDAGDEGHEGDDHANEAPGSHDAEAVDGHVGEMPGSQVEDADGHDHVSETGGEATFDHRHDEASAIKLSQQARANIGLSTIKIELQPFERTITVPGLIVEQPGFSRLVVTTPMTGVVTRVYPLQGEAVKPGQPLFDVRLTHEDLLQAQTDFLRTVEELDVIRREVARLEKVSAEGAIAGKTLLERQYEQQKQEAHLRAQEQALLLHGLSREQITSIAATRNLVPSLTVQAPLPQDSSRTNSADPFLQVRELTAAQGKYVTAGETLCTLVDYSQLYVEGQAFEQDVPAITRAAAEGWGLSVVLGSKADGGGPSLAGLKILYLDDNVDVQSRSLPFYVPLPNQLVREEEKPDGRRFVYWQFKPGQRAQIRIPVQRWENRIVLPIEAVALEGPEVYVFEANADHFDRRAVHAEYRDQQWVVIANDGTLAVGATVAASAAHWVQLALKAKSGGGVDPHAGHNH